MRGQASVEWLASLALALGTAFLLSCAVLASASVIETKKEIIRAETRALVISLAIEGSMNAGAANPLHSGEAGRGCRAEGGMLRCDFKDKVVEYSGIFNDEGTEPA